MLRSQANIFIKHPHPFTATGFSAAFPGIKPHLLTLTTNFHVPLYRDILLALGICSVSKESCSNILKSGPGSSITIVVGGAAESLSARPGTADLTLRKRYVVNREVRSVKFDLGYVDSVLSRLPSNMGLSPGSSSTLIPVEFLYLIHRADLVPVFSFGENDVCFSFS